MHSRLIRMFFLAVYAPAIAAFILVVCSDGIVGLRRFLGRALLWRCSVAWYVFLIIGIPLIFIGGSALRGNLFTEPFPFVSLQALSAALLLAAIKGPVKNLAGGGLHCPFCKGSSHPSGPG